MYVICAGMYRACSTWQYEVIAHLIESHWKGIRLGYLTGGKFAAFDDVWGDRPVWSVLKSHEEDPRFTSASEEGRAIAIYAYRDVRDVIFSLMHKRRVTFEALLRQGMVHQILVNDRYWRGRPGVLCQRYEALIADPAAGVEELAAHVGLSLAPGEAAEVAREYSFQANRRRMLQIDRRLRSEGVDLDDPANVQYYDGRTLLHWNHLREGRVGNWRELATPAQRDVLARLCDPWLAENGYETGTRAEPAATARDGLLARGRGRLEAARGRLACALRCASLRHPRSSQLLKRCLGIPAGHVPGRPVDDLASPGGRIKVGASGGRTSRPHFASVSERWANTRR
jgi:Sulfotransferase domain